MLKGGRWLALGSGELDAAEAVEVKVQLLGFALYADAGYIERLLAAFGSEAEEAAAPLATLMPGPHPVLRSLLSISAGTCLFFHERQVVTLVRSCFSMSPPTA